MDNCPDDYNPLQEGFDGDGVGYACDIASGTDISFDATQGVALKNGTSISLGGGGSVPGVYTRSSSTLQQKWSALN
jgi:hypothetical protein